jgi:sugar phosphate isomerase/epimerase
MLHPQEKPMTMGRRAVLVFALAASASAVLAKSPQRVFGRKGLPLGLNLYVLAGAFRKDIEGTLKSVAEIGYREVELSLDVHAATTVKAGLDRAGLRCSSLNVLPKALRGGLSLEDETGKIAEAVHTLDADYLSCTLFPLPDGVQMRPQSGESLELMFQRVSSSIHRDDWLRTAEFLNAKGEAFKRHGVKFSYHNHNPEFVPHGETNGLVMLLEHTDPKLVHFHMDAGWVVAAGHDPVELIKAYPGRFRLMHVKDLAAAHQVNTALKAATVEVGAGIVNWKRVVGAAMADGMRHFCVEQEPPYSMPEIEAARRSFAYLDALEL